ncbi:unnamed protein product [Rhizophagus irregularis]|nr:unnamed protein product [Rhizophagus irregularis]
MTIRFLSQKKKLLDRVRKDLEEVASSVSEYDITCKKKAQEILDDWKNWKNSGEDSDNQNNASVNIGHLQVEQFATGNAQVINNRIKHCRDVSNGREVTTPSKKIKTTSELSVEDESSGSALPLHHIKAGDNSLVDHNEASPSNGHDESDDLSQTDAEINAESLDDDGMSASDYEKFREKYSSMETSKKWRLSTGTVVEDKLYDFGLRCAREHLSHSFILDPDDENYLNEGVFTKGELAEIRKFQAKPLPTMSKELATYLNTFRPGTTAELRQLVFRQEAMDQNFDRQKDFDRDWIRNTVYNLLREYEANSLKKDHLELWLLLHVWSFIDKAFENLGDVEAARGESCSLASSERKNKKRTVSALIKVKRKILGRRGDLIIRKISLEYGCSEAGMFYRGQNDTKLLRERGLKTPKMMKDMFYRLCESVDWVEQKIRKVETIGFLHAGLMMMMLRLDSPSGYICRISRSKSLSIPSQVEEFGAKALPCILLAWMAKTIVANTIRLVEQEDEDNVNEEDQLQQLLNSCEASNIISPPSPKRAETHLPHFPGNSNTPSKKQRVLLFDQDQLGPPIPFKLTQKKVAK